MKTFFLTVCFFISSFSFASKEEGRTEESMKVLFTARKLPPFYDDATTTEFETESPLSEIFSSLKEALQNLNCEFSVDPGEGRITFETLFQGNLLKAVFRVYRKTDNRFLVRFQAVRGGNRISYVCLFYDLVQEVMVAPRLQKPKFVRSGLKRDCCRFSDGELISEPFLASRTSCFVDMLKDPFQENVLTGAMSLARACCCVASSKLYAEDLTEIIVAFQSHRNSGPNCISSAEVILNLAAVIGQILLPDVNCLTLEKLDSVLVLLRYAKQKNANTFAARFCDQVVERLCKASPALRSHLLEFHKSLTTRFKGV